MRGWHKTDNEAGAGAEKEIDFPVAYRAILARMMAIDPVQYAGSRNFVKGAVTYLSPYLSRGVISTRQVFESLQERGFSFRQTEKLVSELAWRDFFQRVWQAKGSLIFKDLRQPQPGVHTQLLPEALILASTGISAVDAGIRQLQATGYMHNHLRMYTASIACNIALAHWQLPSAWMYYHLLDGDLASNTLSWQWVAAAFSGKKYYCNQENIDKYTGSHQSNSYLHVPYEGFPLANIPGPLKAATLPNLQTKLPVTPLPAINPNLPLLLYNCYNLDPLWRSSTGANRILLLEPSHFNRFPVSEKVISFITSLATQNIPGIQVFTGEWFQVPFIEQVPAVYAKEHPAFTHYPGIKDHREWLVPETTGYFPSFFAYWKKIAGQLQKTSKPGQ